MTNVQAVTWERFKAHYREYPSVQLSLDLSRVDWTDDFFDEMRGSIAKAFESMAQLEAGAVANPDENRMVGHYWLRNSLLAPTKEIRESIDGALADIKAFTTKVHSGEIRGETGRFTDVIVIGIGGSALGPLFVSNALSNSAQDKMSFHLLDNTDPDGIDRVLSQLRKRFGQTLCVVISKSGGTKETRNGMLEAKAAYDRAGLRFSRHAVAVTQDGSQLDQLAMQEEWIKRFPMWDWVGGRTSELSAVGLLPAALQGFDIDRVIQGAREMDDVTRIGDHDKNPAMGMALAWYSSGNGRGDKNLVILPYKDRLELLSKYLQQLIMESIGKKQDLAGNVVHQGMSVFGNKGSTDQHSFVQQLRDGRNDFIVTFIEVLKDRQRESIAVEEDLTSGDFLQGFLLGTRHALTESNRESITITIHDVTPYAIGAMIALFERTVGFYASLIGINAYHQPGVEAGKRAAGDVVDLKKSVSRFLDQSNGSEFTAPEIAESIGKPEAVETVFQLCNRLAANGHLTSMDEGASVPTQRRFRRL